MPEFVQPIRSSGFFVTRPTLGSLIDGETSRQNAFDLIRLLAASAVILSHSFLITAGSNDQEPLHWLTNGQTTIGGTAVGVFFTISGLLISASFVRSRSTMDFALKRALRIVPAFLVATIICALVVGPIATTLPFQIYMTSADTWRYLTNAFFLPNIQILPGLFTFHSLPYMNGSTWTLKFELLCYLGIAILLSFGRAARFLVLAAWALSFIIPLVFSDPAYAKGVMFFVITGSKLFRFFGTGAILYLYRDRLPVSKPLIAASLLVCALSAFTPLFLETAAILGAYAVICSGYLSPKWISQITARGDISYGVYVYGWPIQQLVWPIGLDNPMHWAINTAIALPLAMGAGVLSWVLVEKPAMRLKKRLRSTSVGVV
jgi:peptidoglycan/LPS O-acetylase OafA/YrhL